jgi:nucleoside-diphosphate-sugar epimerase
MYCNRKILVTGAAGFIGSKVCEFHLTKPNLIPQLDNKTIRPSNHKTVNVLGIDNINDYDDVRLKERRLLADMMATWADITKAKNILAWQPTINLEQGIESAVQWFIENRSWTKNIKL